MKEYRELPFSLSDLFASPFDPLAKNPLIVILSVRNYLLSAALADYSYFGSKYPGVSIKAKLIELGADDIEFVNERRRIKNDDVDSQAILFRFDKKIFVLCAGTNDKTDAKRDADFFFEDVSWGGRCHNGVSHCAQVLKPRINEYLARAENVHSTMLFIGHSLGKGIAEKLAADYEQQGKAVERVIGFGGLKIWDDRAAFIVAKRLGQRLDFFRCGPDIVPATPPEKLGFREAIDRWEISSTGRFLETDRQAWLGRGLARLKWYFSPQPFLASPGERTAAVHYHLLRNSYLPLVAKAYRVPIDSLLI